MGLKDDDDDDYNDNDDDVPAAENYNNKDNRLVEAQQETLGEGGEGRHCLENRRKGVVQAPQAIQRKGQ